MKLRDLYSLKGTPFVTYTLTAVCLILSCMVCYIIPEHFSDICMQTKPEHLWQYFSGIFIHNISPRWVLWVHMGMNLMGLIPMGLIVEKVLGSRNTFILFLAEMLVTAICFQVVTWNNPGQACGISSITYAISMVAFYCVYVVLKRGQTKAYKQGWFYYFLFEGLGMLSMLNPMSGMTSFVLHISGVMVGGAYVLFMRKSINRRIFGEED